MQRMQKKTVSRKGRFSDKMLNGVVMALMAFLLILVIYPLVYVVSSSFSSGAAVSAGKVILWPVDLSLTGYKLVFSYRQVWTGYRNTLFYTLLGTLLNVVMTTMAAYPLSRKSLHGKHVYMAVFMFTMFFSGGLIPAYILMTQLHLVDTRAAILLCGTISVYNMLIMRTFFQNSIPNELLEASRMDGITDVGYLMKIVLPLSKPIFAVITLYYAVAHWNSYFYAMIYLRDRDKMPLQMVLRDILNASRIDLSQITDAELLAELQGASDVMKYALIVVSSVPILILYPFVQRFFEKGVMIGSVKG